MKAIELSLENYMDTLSLPVVLSGFNWKRGGRILHSRSALNFFLNTSWCQTCFRETWVVHTSSFVSLFSTLLGLRLMGSVGNLHTVVGFAQPSLAL